MVGGGQAIIVDIYAVNLPFSVNIPIVIKVIEPKITAVSVPRIRTVMMT
jgi:hypothetical protein